MPTIFRRARQTEYRGPAFAKRPGFSFTSGSHTLDEGEGLAVPVGRKVGNYEFSIRNKIR